MSIRRRSLRSTLTRSMIVMQAVVLTSFAFVAAIPIIHLLGSGQMLDDRVVGDLVSSIVRNQAGDLELHPNKRIDALSSEYPFFWAFVTDADGNSASLGRLPDVLVFAAPNLSRINAANIADIGNPDAPAAIVRTHDSKVGKLWVMTGGGPSFGPQQLFIAFSNPFFVGLLLFLSLTSLLVIPFILRHQFRGVEEVAKVADTIDVDQRGVRLSASSVPSELHGLVNAINQALQRLDEGAERQHRFMADAAHELRTPIAILQTRLELLPENEDKHRLLLDVARLGSMANQLLDLQRMDLSPQPFERLDLVKVVSQVAADLAPLAIAAGDEISFESDAESVFVMGDSGALSRAVTNLIQNAIAHGGRGVSIAVSVLHDGSFRVTDTGPGIGPGDQSEIFEPFHRVTPLQHGAGLGLNLVRDIVRRHHGRVSVNNAVEGGAEFEVCLPLAAPAVAGAKSVAT